VTRPTVERARNGVAKIDRREIEELLVTRKKGRTLPPERTLRYAQVRYILYLPEL